MLGAGRAELTNGGAALVLQDDRGARGDALELKLTRAGYGEGLDARGLPVLETGDGVDGSMPGDSVLGGSVGGELHAQDALSCDAVGVDVAVQVLLTGSGKLCVGLHHTNRVAIGEAERVLPAFGDVGFYNGPLHLHRVDGVVVGVDVDVEVFDRAGHEKLVLVNGVGLSKGEDRHQAEQECGKKAHGSRFSTTR